MKNSLLLIIVFVYPMSTNAASDIVDLLDAPEDKEKYWVSTYKAPPVYPRRAFDKRISGCVVFSFVVKGGFAKEIEIYDEAPKNIFRIEAREALEQYRWRAASANPDRLPIRTTVKISFSNKNSGPYEEFYCERSGFEGLRKVEDVEIKSDSKRKHRCASKSTSRLLKKCSGG